MIRILIVDDSSPKRDKIKQTILDHHNIGEELVSVATCMKEARKALYAEYFDLMILDLVLPVEDGSECVAQNGIDFLNEIQINPSIKPPIHIVGMSGYRDQVAAAHDQFASKLWNLIDYDESSSAWEDKLNSIIFHLLKVRQQFVGASIEEQSQLVAKYLEENNMPNINVGLNWLEIMQSICVCVERSLEVPQKFSNGTRAVNINKTNLKIESEYDFQNLIHLVLRPWEPSTEPENVAVIFDGNTKNADFSIKGNSIIVEAKYIDTTGKKNDTLKTLEGLKAFYAMNANVRGLLFLILVEDSVDLDKHKLESEFSYLTESPGIIVKVFSNSLKG